MPVSALVITLSSEHHARQGALSWLAEDERFLVGERQNDQLPVVLQTDGLREGAHLIRKELPEVEGIDFVHVISVDFSDLDTQETTASEPVSAHAPGR